MIHIGSENKINLITYNSFILFIFIQFGRAIIYKIIWPSKIYSRLLLRVWKGCQNFKKKELWQITNLIIIFAKPIFLKEGLENPSVDVAVAVDPRLINPDSKGTDYSIDKESLKTSIMPKSSHTLPVSHESNSSENVEAFTNSKTLLNANNF